jgi:hypothetical protein
LRRRTELRLGIEVIEAKLGDEFPISSLFTAGETALAAHLHPGGVFALWSDDAPDEGLLRSLGAVFIDCEARVVEFPNPLLRTTASCTIYLATKGAG